MREEELPLEVDEVVAPPPPPPPPAPLPPWSRVLPPLPPPPAKSGGSGRWASWLILEASCGC